MDTKSRNYKKPVCFLSGLLFMTAGTLVMKESCRIFWLYDLDNFLRYQQETEMLQLKENTYQILESVLSESWMAFLIYMGVALLALGLCIWMTGTKISWFDKIFTEIQIGIFVLAAIGLVGLEVIHMDCLMHHDWTGRLLAQMELSNRAMNALDEWLGYYDMTYGTTFQPQWLETFFAYAASAVLLGFCLILLLSWVKKIKAKCFWKNTFVGAIVYGITGGIKQSKGVMGKVIALLIIGAVLSATWIGLIVVIGFILFFVPKQVKKYIAIREGVHEVRDGNLDYKIPVENDGELDRLAESINQISAATSVAVANELKNQRLKTDLISNVSHDLKTPLTSMISYVDLLKTEGLDSENATEYLQIIDEKTKRLQKLTEDLFEAAKASSGSIPVNMEPIEMTSIVNQALAEVGGRLEAGDLDVIFTNKTEHAVVMADGQLLWRVMENLLVNVSKYALPGSRVYLDISDDSDGCILMEIKNMSKDRLNIDADELMERFKRGDESRNTEGSGLGLAIAKDLVKLMEGQFAITVDGDLFKVSIGLIRAAAAEF